MHGRYSKTPQYTQCLPLSFQVTDITARLLSILSVLIPSQFTGMTVGLHSTVHVFNSVASELHRVYVCTCMCVCVCVCMCVCVSMSVCDTHIDRVVLCVFVCIASYQLVSHNQASENSLVDLPNKLE